MIFLLETCFNVSKFKSPVIKIFLYLYRKQDRSNLQLLRSSIVEITALFEFGRMFLLIVYDCGV